jgi:hypothetical protein
LDDAALWFTEALIYGHTDKKEIEGAVEGMMDKLVEGVLGKDEFNKC